MKKVDYSSNAYRGFPSYADWYSATPHQREVAKIMVLSPSEINRLNFKQMQRIAKILNKETKYRIKALRSIGENVPALQMLEKWNVADEFGFSGRENLPQLKRNIPRMLNFLEAKTSTVEGARKVKEDFLDRIFEGIPEENDIRGRMSKEQINRFWDIYNRAREEIPANSWDSNQMQKDIASMMDTKTDKEIRLFLRKKFGGSFNDKYKNRRKNKSPIAISRNKK